MKGVMESYKFVLDAEGGEVAMRLCLRGVGSRV